MFRVKPRFRAAVRAIRHLQQPVVGVVVIARIAVRAAEPNITHALGLVHVVLDDVFARAAPQRRVFVAVKPVRQLVKIEWLARGFVNRIAQSSGYGLLWCENGFASRCEFPVVVFDEAPIAHEGHAFKSAAPFDAVFG